MCEKREYEGRCKWETDPEAGGPDWYARCSRLAHWLCLFLPPAHPVSCAAAPRSKSADSQPVIGTCMGGP